MRLERQAEFRAKGEDGKTYTIVVWVEMLTSMTLGRGRKETPGMIRLRTADGLSVNRLSPGEYEIVQTDLKMTAIDPEPFTD